MEQPTIGLFGTCGKSTWRNDFINEYQKSNINYFNPQLPEGTWKPSDAQKEAMHLAIDQIILFPVLNSTYGLGSLSEVGFSILNAIRLDHRRNFIILIDKKVNQSLNDPQLATSSNTARNLVLEHLKKLKLDNVYLVENLSDMLKLSLKLYRMEQLKIECHQFQLNKKRK